MLEDKIKEKVKLLNFSFLKHYIFDINDKIQINKMYKHLINYLYENNIYNDELNDFRPIIVGVNVKLKICNGNIEILLL